MTQTVAFDSLPTEIGQELVAVTGAGLVAIREDTPGMRSLLAKRLRAEPVPDPFRTDPVLAQLRAYFDGTATGFDLEIDWQLIEPTGQQVLETLYRTVGYGQVITYGELADRAGGSVPARGIGAILGANPIPIVVPCHRVVASDGLGGFSAPGGVGSKRKLLALEGQLPAHLW